MVNTHHVQLFHLDVTSHYRQAVLIFYQLIHGEPISDQDIRSAFINPQSRLTDGLQLDFRESRSTIPYSGQDFLNPFSVLVDIRKQRRI